MDTVASFTCNYGYLQSGSNSSSCLTSGSWNVENPRCNQSKIILFPPSQKFKQFFQKKFERQFLHKCKYFFLNVVTCVVLSLQNGQISYNDSQATNGEYPVDTVASFSCNYGHSRSGSNSRTCQIQGDWDQETPTCNQSKLKSD